MKDSRKQDMKRVLIAGSVVGGIALIASAFRRSKPLETVDQVDIGRYMGKWYEIAAFPARFERNCICTTAEYTLNDDGTVAVDNRCYNAKKKKWEGATATGFVQDKTTNAQLAVQFFWPFKGDYYIIALADDYSYAHGGRTIAGVPLDTEPNPSTIGSHLRPADDPGHRERIRCAQTEKDSTKKLHIPALIFQPFGFQNYLYRKRNGYG